MIRVLFLVIALFDDGTLRYQAFEMPDVATCRKESREWVDNVQKAGHRLIRAECIEIRDA